MHGDISRVNYYAQNRRGLLKGHGEGEGPGWRLNQVFNMERNQAEVQRWREARLAR